MVFKILFMTKHPLYISLSQRRVNKSLSTHRNDMLVAFSCMSGGEFKALVQSLIWPRQYFLH